MKVDETLKRYRESIDNIDAALVFMLAERFKITQAVGAYKAAQASVSIGRIRLPPPAIRWPASSGISATLLCMRSRMTALTPFRSLVTKAISASSEGSRAGLSGWMVAATAPRLGADEQSGNRGSSPPRSDGEE
jgi:hypothetical protein